MLGVEAAWSNQLNVYFIHQCKANAELCRSQWKISMVLLQALLSDTTCPQKCSEPQTQSHNGAPGALHLASRKVRKTSLMSWGQGTRGFAPRGWVLHSSSEFSNSSQDLEDNLGLEKKQPLNQVMHMSLLLRSWKPWFILSKNLLLGYVRI